MTIKRIGAVSLAKINGTLYAIIGLFAGAFFSLMALVGGFAGQGPSHVNPLGVSMVGVGSIVFFPLLYGAVGFVFSLFAAWLYNILAGVVGGIRIEVE